MSRRHYVNNAAVVEITGSITNSQTTITVSDASSFPTQFPWTAVIDAGLPAAEVVLVGAAAGNVLSSVTRGYDGTSGQTHAANAAFAHVAVKADYDEANLHVNSSSGVHGVVGSVVGTTDAQTLTGKTLTAPVISTISNTGTLTLPTSTDTLVGRATADTLTNKTLTSPVINTAAVNGATINAASTIGGVSGTAIATLPRGFLGDAESSTSATMTTTSRVAGAAKVTFTLPDQRRVRIYCEGVYTTTGTGRFALNVGYQSGSSFTSSATHPQTIDFKSVSITNETAALVTERTVLLAAGTYSAGGLGYRIAGTSSDVFTVTHVAVYDVGNA